MAKKSNPLLLAETVQPLRFDANDSARVLGISRALLYQRIRSGAIRASKDGARTFITAEELHRYVQSCHTKSVERAS